MSLRCQVFTEDGVWVAPAGVSLVRVNWIAAGGGGSHNQGVSGFYQSSGKSGGGSGEFCLNFPVPVTPGSTYAVSVGTPGAGGIGSSDTDATDGGTATFNGFRVLGGKAALGSSGGTADAGNGGGPNGGIGISVLTPVPWIAGTEESPVHFGGASGGAGGSLGGQDGGAGGQIIGQYTASGGAHNVNNNRGGGGGGGCSIWASGAVGGDGTAGGIGGSATSYGCGGGGSSGTGLGPPEGHQIDGGAGVGGVLQIFWFKK